MEKKNKGRKIRILFFIGSLNVGGKERRLIELLDYLQNRGGYELRIVVTKQGVYFSKFNDLNIEMTVLDENSFIYKFNYFFHFHKIVKEFNPHIIHAWGRMQTLYALPSVLMNKIKLINGQITDASPKVALVDSLIDRINFRFSDFILSNSLAGIDAFRPPKIKSGVIYNGLDLKRFDDLPPVQDVKRKYKIQTKYLIIMIANYSPRKDYETFFRLGTMVTKGRTDTTWMGVGYFDEESELVKNCRDIIGDNPFLRMQPEISDVEALVNACDIGILFSNTAVHGEGVSNAVIEYMALGKPVVANDAGGTREVVIHNENGYLVQKQTDEEAKNLILNLIDNSKLRTSFGRNGRIRIERDFSLDTMGEAFVALYYKTLNDFTM